VERELNAHRRKTASVKAPEALTLAQFGEAGPKSAESRSARVISRVADHSVNRAWHYER